jgi:hypothetical protein
VRKREVPLYKKLDKRGRPVKYDYTAFLNPNTTFIVLEYGIEHYNSIRSTLTRWKKISGVAGRFQFDYHKFAEGRPKHWVIWRR